jgi:hypothetical protein
MALVGNPIWTWLVPPVPTMGCVFSVGALSTSSRLKPLQLWLSQAAGSYNAAGSPAWVSSALGVTVFDRKCKCRTHIYQ